jgi:hypothetical protein
MQPRSLRYFLRTWPLWNVLLIYFEEITSRQLTRAMAIIDIDNDKTRALLNRHTEFGISFEATEDKSPS